MAARRRSLTAGEWRGLHPGLVRALNEAGVRPILVSRTHPAARIARLWRGETPILTRGPAIWWPALPADLSAPGLERGMAVLQHELQHVLDYAAGQLTALRYLSRPRHWTYDWRRDPDLGWDRLGAEQRAELAGELWLMEHGLAPSADHGRAAALIPWAGTGDARDALA